LFINGEKRNEGKCPCCIFIAKNNKGVIPAKAGIQKRHWMPDQVRHDGKKDFKVKLKVVVYVIIGLVIGVAVAKLNFPGYKHAVVMIKRGSGSKPIRIDGNKRQVLALTMKNLQKSKAIEIKMEGAEVQSWFPPVIRMPFFRNIGFETGRFKEVGSGRRLPVYVVFDDNGEHRKIEIIDSTDGSTIQTVCVLRGKGHEDRNH
jgi:hypothetical protein